MDYQAQLEQAKQRAKRYGELAQYQSPQAQMVGGRYVAPHALQYLAAALRAGGGMAGEQMANQEATQVETQRKQAIADALRKFGQQAKGTPENAPGDGMGPVIPAQAPDMMGAYQGLLDAPDQKLQDMALQGMAKIPEAQATRDARADELRMRAEQRAQELQIQHQNRMDQLAANNASREQMAEQQRAFQREMLALRNSMRPEPAPRQAQIIQTDAGPMQLVDGKAIPIQGVNGQPVKAPPGQGGNKPLTESQAKGALYLGQMRSASSELGKLPQVSPVATAAAGNTLTNWAVPAGAQKVSQLQNQWAEAYLRAKTGAAVTQGEVDLNRRTFFPVVGDSQAVIEQKKKMRAQAEQDMQYTAGSAAATAGGITQPNAVKPRIRFDKQGNPMP